MSNIRKILTLSVALTFSVALVGCGGKSAGGLNPEIAGIRGPTVELVDGHFLLSLAIETISIDGGVTIPIPKYPNSSLSVGPDFESNGTLVVLTVAVEDFVKVGIVGMDPQTLPGGRPLPGVSAGALPAIALKVPQLFNTVFYVGPKVLGFFVPIKMNLPGVLAGSMLNYRFHDKTGTPVGLISLVSQDVNKQNSGILVMINIDRRIQTVMNQQLASL